MQQTVQKFTSPCGKASIFVENEMPIGLFHDFLMSIKGLMVNRMVQAQQEQESQANAMKALESPEDAPAHESELPSCYETASCAEGA